MGFAKSKGAFRKTLVETGDRPGEPIEGPLRHCQPNELPEEETDKAQKVLLARPTLSGLGACAHSVAADACHLRVARDFPDRRALVELRGMPWVQHFSNQERSPQYEAELQKEWHQQEGT